MTSNQQQQQQNLFNDLEKQHKIMQFKWPTLLSTDVSKPTINWLIGSRFVIPTVGLFSKFWMNVVNKSTVYNANVLYDAINRNYLSIFSSNNKHQKYLPRRPLITYCNHTSCMDDPLIWGSLMPLHWLLNSNRLRWTSAAAEICFSSTFNTTFFALGKTFPMIRGDGIYQPAMDYASRLMKQGHWLHFFPEGKVIPRPENADPELLKFNYDDYNCNTSQLINNNSRLFDNQYQYSLKWGIARLIIEHVLSEGKELDDEYDDIIKCEQNMDNLPPENKTTNDLPSNNKTLPEVDVLPMYHFGMDDILPTRKPYIPRIFCHVTFLIRPEGPIRIDKNFLMKLFSQDENDDKTITLSLTEKRIKLMKFLEKELNLLAAKTRALHFNREDK